MSIYRYYYEMGIKQRGNRFNAEIKNYCIESLQHDYENALINEIIVQFLRECNEKSYIGKYTIKYVKFIKCERSNNNEDIPQRTRR